MVRASPARPQRSACPIATALELLGDRWTLLVVRDLLFSKRCRFGELLGSPEEIPTNLLSDRLRRLENGGLVRKTLYQRRPRRYEYRLTAAGIDLLPTLRELIHWANRHLPATAVPPAAMLLAPPGLATAGEGDPQGGATATNTRRSTAKGSTRQGAPAKRPAAKGPRQRPRAAGERRARRSTARRPTS